MQVNMKYFKCEIKKNDLNNKKTINKHTIKIFKMMCRTTFLRALHWQIYFKSSLKPGDHLAVQGERNGIEYHHHGIFIGFTEKEGVIHCIGKQETKNGNQLERSDLFEFNGGTKPIKRVIYEANKCFSPERVVETATSLLNGRTKWDDFNLISNNCEHFATYCKTGVAKSKQTEKIEELLNSVKSAIKLYGHKSSACLYQYCWLVFKY